MKLIQFILLGVCLSMLFSSVGATTVYFGHLATRVGVDVGSGEIEDLQSLIDHNQFSAPAADGCGDNQCISFYTNDGLNVDATCIDILHFNKTGDSVPALRKTMAAPIRSDITTVVEPQKAYNLSEEPLPVLSEEPVGLSSSAVAVLEVIVYRDNDYQGTSEIFTASDTNLNDNPIGRNTINSLKIPAGLRVTLYNHQDFVGLPTELTSDTPTLRGTNIGNNDATSIKIETIPSSSSSTGQWYDLNREEFADRNDATHAGLCLRAGANLIPATTTTGGYFCDSSKTSNNGDTIEAWSASGGPSIVLCSEDALHTRTNDYLIQKIYCKTA